MRVYLPALCERGGHGDGICGYADARGVGRIVEREFDEDVAVDAGDEKEAFVCEDVEGIYGVVVRVEGSGEGVAGGEDVFVGLGLEERDEAFAV